jgi:hypothetical protein
MKTVFLAAAVLIASAASASELIFQFHSPSFSGQGYSSHVLTIEQLEQQRRDKIKSDQQAELDKLEREQRNSNVFRFQNNLESRIYAQLSRQIADNIFGEANGADSGVVQTPFGDTIFWEQKDGTISIRIEDSSGNTVSDFTVPIEGIKF